MTKIIYRDQWHYQLYRFWLAFWSCGEVSKTSRCAYFWSCVFAVPLILLTPFLAIYATIANFAFLIFILTIGHLPTERFWWWHYYKQEVSQHSRDCEIALPGLLFLAVPFQILIIIPTISYLFGLDATIKLDLVVVFLGFLAFISTVVWAVSYVNKLIRPANWLSNLGIWWSKHIGSKIGDGFAYIATLGENYCTPIEFAKRSQTRESPPQESSQDQAS